MSRRVHVRHQPIADGLRAVPGEWGEVGNYWWHDAAMGTVWHIRRGKLAAYLPAGSFEAEIRRDDEGDAHVFARYIGNAEH